MFIAFEGPDNVGKSTSAANLAHDGVALYNATKEMHQRQQEEQRIYPEYVPITYDRIDWFSHMVYRLALPDRDWNDDRPRTVFAMPDTHLVVKLHRPDLADFTADEVVNTPIVKVNPMYYYFADFFMNLNHARNFELFRSVSILVVANTGEGYSQRMAAFSSRTLDESSARAQLVNSDESLLELLHHVEQQEG